MFGPRPRSYAFSMPKKVRKLGLKMALSTRFSEEQLVVLEAFQLDAIKTKAFRSVMMEVGLENALIIIPERNESLEKSSRNVPGYKVLPTEGLNVYDILLHKHVVLLKPCIGQLEERLLS